MFKKSTTTAHPNGHFYSPVVDTSTLTTKEDVLWNNNPQIRGIDFNSHFHKKVLEDLYSKHIGKYDYAERSEETKSEIEFYTQNSQFSWLDSRTLFVLLNEWKPKKTIEVGSGFSSLLAADCNHRFLNDNMNLTCIEPYPRKFLTQDIPGLSEVIIDKVENLDPAIFESLDAGDILFIDSSHVSKTGSDVNFLYFDIFPLLKKGVRVHIHDIFLPNEYPKEWVIDENRSWNEQYLLRALLMYSSAFKVLFGCAYAMHKFPELVAKALNRSDCYGYGGGSFWIERI